MASRLDKLFAPFEGTRSPYPLAVFRIAFFAGLALHFFPALLWLDQGYRPGALRTEEWNHWLYLYFAHLSHGQLRGLSLLTMLACLTGLAGFKPRLSALVAGLGCYAFASFNGLRLQTLAIVDAWAILLLFILCGGGGAALSVDAVLRRRRAPQAAPPREPSLLPSLLLYQTLLAVFFSGLEKLRAGWPGSDQMAILLGYPRGFLVRDWVAASAFLRSGLVTHGLTWLTLVVELGAPPLLLIRRTRRWALIGYQLFFLGIVAMLEVPPLFYCMFAFGALLALSDAEVDGMLAWLRRRRGGRRG